MVPYPQGLSVISWPWVSENFLARFPTTVLVSPSGCSRRRASNNLWCPWPGWITDTSVQNIPQSTVVLHPRRSRFDSPNPSPFYACHAGEMCDYFARTFSTDASGGVLTLDSGIWIWFIFLRTILNFHTWVFIRGCRFGVPVWKKVVSGKENCKPEYY